MKKILLLLPFILLSCKKNKSTPVEPVVTTQQPIVTPKEIVFNYDPSSLGSLYIFWDYTYNGSLVDSLYSTPTSIIIKRNVIKDTICFRFFSSWCSNCPLDVSSLTISINGIIKKSYSNDYGCDYRYIVLN